MKEKTRTLVFMAVLIGIMILFGFTPIGYIPLPFARLTLMCLPVIIGTLVLGLKTGMGLSLIFIITSIWQLLVAPDALSVITMYENPVGYVLCLVIPRLLIAPVTYGANKLLEKKLPRGGMFIACALGSLVNTFGYLGMVRAFFLPALCTAYTLDVAGANAMIWTVVLTNGIPEAVLAAVICPFIARALRKSIPPIETPKKEKPA